MTSDRPRLSVVGGSEHLDSGKPQASIGSPADKTKTAVELLRALAQEIELGRRPVDDMIVVHSVPPIDSGLTTDISFVTTPGTDPAMAYWLLGRVQNRMTLVENASSAPAD